MNTTLDACWRRIGVYGGDLSCPRLVESLHCRNCALFADAARSLFARESMPEDSAAEATLAAIAAGLRALVFRLGAQWFALPTACLAEVTPDRPLRRLPHRNAGHLQGLVNLRGELQPCVSLAGLFGLGSTPAPNAAKLIVLRSAAEAVLAFRADAVRGLLYYQAEQLQPAPATYPTPLAQCVAGILEDGELRPALLDGEALGRVLNQGLFA